jgi:hypothetical protein
MEWVGDGLIGKDGKKGLRLRVDWDERSIGQEAGDEA